MSFLSKVKKNEVKVCLSEYLFLIRGEAKIGKTTFYANLIEKFYGTPEAGLLIPFETGYKAISNLNLFPYTISEETNIDGEIMSGWSVFKGIVDELVKTAGQNGIKAICIDTVDRFIDVAVAETIRQSRIKTKKPCSSINEAFNGFGRGKEFLFKMVKSELQRLRDAGYGIFVIGHVKNKTIKDKINQEEYQMLASNLSEDYDGIFAHDADFIIMLSMEKHVTDDKVVGAERFIRMRSDGYYAAGSRFPDVPEKIELDVDAFISTFEKAIKSASGKTDEEIAELKVKQSQEKQEKAEHLKSESAITIFNELKDLISKSNDNLKQEFIMKIKELGLNPKDIKESDLEAIKELRDIFKN